MELDITRAEETSTQSKRWEFPYWSNKENAHITVTMISKSGEKRIASVQGEENPDYIEIINEFGVDQIDKNTEDGLRRREDNIRKAAQRKETERMRMQQETLFQIKLEAFEIPAVKKSENKDLKKLIRKAKSPMEVQAYTTILVMKELENEES